LANNECAAGTFLYLPGNGVISLGGLAGAVQQRYHSWGRNTQCSGAGYKIAARQAAMNEVGEGIVELIRHVRVLGSLPRAEALFRRRKRLRFHPMLR